jgi:hypothetical protein
MALNLSEIEKTNGVFKQLSHTTAHAPADVADPSSIIENVLGFPRGMVFYGQIDCTKPQEIESKLPYLMEAHLNPPNPLVSGHHGVFGTLQGLNASFGGYIEKVKDLEQQKQDLQNQLNNRPNNSAELQRLKDENSRQSQEIQHLNADLATKNMDLQQKDAEIASLKTQLAASPTQAALNAANAEIARLKAENEALKKENAKLKDAANDVVDPKKLKLFYTQVRTVQQQIAELLIQKQKANDVHGGVVANVLRAQQATTLAVLATFNDNCVTQGLANWLGKEDTRKVVEKAIESVKEAPTDQQANLVTGQLLADAIKALDGVNKPIEDTVSRLLTQWGSQQQEFADDLQLLAEDSESEQKQLAEMLELLATLTAKTSGGANI